MCQKPTGAAYVRQPRAFPCTEWGEEPRPSSCLGDPPMLLAWRAETRTSIGRVARRARCPRISAGKQARQKSGSVAACDRARDPVLPANLGEEMGRGAGGTHLRLRVKRPQAEALGPA